MSFDCVPCFHYSETCAEPASPAPPRQESWHWLIEALAEELVREPEGTADAVVQSLLSRFGHELADDRFDPDREARRVRLDLVHRLAGRVARCTPTQPCD